MTYWVCGIRGCGASFEGAAAVVQHQARRHEDRECAVCGEEVSPGFLAIRHAFESHTRAEYLRAYDADSDDIREREELLELVEERVDVPGLLSGLGSDAEPAVSVGD